MYRSHQTFLEVQYIVCIIITEKNGLKTFRDYCICRTQFCKSWQIYIIDVYHIRTITFIESCVPEPDP
jgi:hypothetical protein